MAREIGEIKRRQGRPVQDFEVEKAVLDHALAQAQRLGLPADPVRLWFRILLESSVDVQERDRAGAVPGAGPRRALVLGGAGRMGSWFVRYLGARGFEVRVEDPRAPAASRPREGDPFDLVLVATPPSLLAESLERARVWCRRGTLLVDIASVKGHAVAGLQGLAADGVQVASLHPLFGPSAETLGGRIVLVMDCGAAAAKTAAAALFEGTAARLEEVPLAEHDRIMAEVLGLSHATSLAFNEALQHGPYPVSSLEKWASTTFRRQVELSREVAQENPDLYFEIQRLNPETPAVLERLEEAVVSLRSLVARGDRKGFEAFMERAASYYKPEVRTRSR